MATSTKKTTARRVPVGTVIWLSMCWVVPLIALLIFGSFTNYHIEYEHHQMARRLAAGLLVALAIIGMLYALDVVGQNKGSPWYTNGFLVALVLFWGLCPPTWFFTDYYLVDQKALGLPPDVIADIVAAVDAKGRKDVFTAHLAATKTYADLASKIWVAVGAALATAIGFANR
jgi:hypothetical protein